MIPSKPFMSDTVPVTAPSIASLRSLVLNPMFRAVSSLSPVKTQSWIPAWWLNKPFRKTNHSDLHEYICFLKQTIQLQENYTTTLKESRILLWYFWIFNHPIYLISNYLETSTGSPFPAPWNSASRSFSMASWGCQCWSFSIYLFHRYWKPQLLKTWTNQHSFMIIVCITHILCK